MNASLELPPVPPEHIAALSNLQSISVSCEHRPNGVYELAFNYTAWSSYRTRCFRELARRAGLRCATDIFRSARHLQLFKIAAAFTGSKKAYAARSRKISYARMIAALRDILPNLTEQTVELLAGAALSHCKHGVCAVFGSVQFKVSWDMETLREFLAYRRHELPADSINSATDIDRYVVRYLDSLPFSCRRMVKRYVLQHRHYCRDYDAPELLKAIDCSFKYTGSAYAFRKARHIALALLVPEIFFKIAGQKIRKRQYADWLREQREHFADISHSLLDIPDPDNRFKSWADLECHSRDWHARQIAEARIGMRQVGYEPFDLAPEVSRTFNLRGYTFSLLASPEAIADESVQMQHCIHGYADSVRCGEYLAYKVEGGSERATLGIRKTQRGWAFDQVRRKRNVLASEELRAACMEFTSVLNTEIRGSGRKMEVA